MGNEWIGTECFWVNYDFRSLDGGKHWYAVSNNIDSGTVVILGEADKVYPGLMRCMSDWDGLFDYVKTNGPINPSHPEDLQKLESAGFTVTKK